MLRDRRIHLLALFFLVAACKHPVKTKEWPAGMTAEAPEQVVARVRTPGAVTLFVIYASWCTSCRKELPMIGELSAAYAKKGMRVVALSTDEDPQDFAEMLSDHPFPFPLLRLSAQASLPAAVQSYGGTYHGVIPYTALFDRTGKLVKEWPEGDATKPALEAAVAPLL